MMPTDKSLRLPSEVAIGTPGPGRTAGVRPPSPHSRVWLAGRASTSTLPDPSCCAAAGGWHGWRGCYAASATIMSKSRIGPPRPS